MLLGAPFLVLLFLSSTHAQFGICSSDADCFDDDPMTDDVCDVFECYNLGINVVDDFESGIINNPGTTTIAGPPNAPLFTSSHQSGTMMGRERDVQVSAEKYVNAGPDGSAKTLIASTCASSADSNIYGGWWFTWDGIDGLTTVRTSEVLRDWTYITQGSGIPAIRMEVSDVDHCIGYELRIYTGGTFHQVTVQNPAIFIPGCIAIKPAIVNFLLSDYTALGANLADIRAIEIVVDSKAHASDALDFVFDDIRVCSCVTLDDCSDGDLGTFDYCIDCLCQNLATKAPTLEPTIAPTLTPTLTPTVEPTVEPTLAPTLTPTNEPTLEPTIAPTAIPTEAQDCPNPCNDAEKGAICFPDQSGHTNLICVMHDVLTDYLNNGGFYPGTMQDDGPYDCICNTPDKVTDPPIDPDALTADPTMDPTVGPTATPTMTPTTVPTSVPTESEDGEITDLICIDQYNNGTVVIPQEMILVVLYKDLDQDLRYTFGEPEVDDDWTNVNGYFHFENLEKGYYVVVFYDDLRLLQGYDSEMNSLLDEYGDPKLDMYGVPLEIEFDISNRSMSFMWDPRDNPDLENTTAVGEVSYYLSTNSEQLIATKLPYWSPPPHIFDDCPGPQVPEMDYGYEFRCIMDSHGNVDLSVLNMNDTDHVDWIAMEGAVWPLGESTPMFGLKFMDNIGVDFDCWCHPQCDWGGEHQHEKRPFLMYHDSWFRDDILRLVVAIPKNYDQTHLYFRNANMTKLSAYDCMYTYGVEDPGSSPYCWMADYTNQTETYFRHNCWDAYIMELPFSDMSSEFDYSTVYNGSDTTSGQTTYYLNLAMELTEMKVENERGGVTDQTDFGNIRASITFPVQVTAHAEDLRIYDEVHKIDSLVEAIVNVTDFGWGFNWGQHSVEAFVTVQTSVQWPFRLDLITYTARMYPANFGTFFWDQDDSRCTDPMIAEYGNPDWDTSAASNFQRTGILLPEPCIQLFTLKVVQLDEFQCNFDDYYDLEFAVSCQPTYTDADHCPLDNRYEPLLKCNFWLTTEDTCDIYAEKVEVTAEMDSYECSERTCECTKEDFIQNFVNPNDHITPEPERIYFSAKVESTEPLLATQVNSIETTLICQNTATPSMVEIYNHEDGWVFEIAGFLVNYPPPIVLDDQCMEGTTQNVVMFDFDLPQSFFQIPFDDSCELHVWLMIDLFYRGVDRPDGEIPLNIDPITLLEDDEGQDQIYAFEEGPRASVRHAIRVSEKPVVDAVEAGGDEANNDVVESGDAPAAPVDGQQKASAMRGVPCLLFAIVLTFLTL